MLKHISNTYIKVSRCVNISVIHICSLFPHVKNGPVCLLKKFQTLIKHVMPLVVLCNKRTNSAENEKNLKFLKVLNNLLQK